MLRLIRLDGAVCQLQPLRDLPLHEQETQACRMGNGPTCGGMVGCNQCMWAIKKLAGHPSWEGCLGFEEAGVVELARCPGVLSRQRLGALGELLAGLHGSPRG